MEGENLELFNCLNYEGFIYFLLWGKEKSLYTMRYYYS